MKNALQRFGKFLSAMVMPNIGAFIDADLPASGPDRFYRR